MGLVFIAPMGVARGAAERQEAVEAQPKLFPAPFTVFTYLFM